MISASAGTSLSVGAATLLRAASRSRADAMRSASSTLLSSKKRSSGAMRHDSFRAMSERIRPDAFWNAAATSS